MVKDEEPREEEEYQPIKIDKWDGAAVKNTLDDSVRRVFVDGFKYSECNRLLDIRLGICLTAVGAAGFALAYDYVNPFPASKMVLISCVATYFFLMTVLTVYTTFVEKGIFLQAYDGKNKWTVSSSLKRFDDIYDLSIELAADGGRATDVTISKSVAEWFDVDGVFLDEKFEQEVRRLHSQVKKNK